MCAPEQDRLREYRAKRDFAATPEPAGEVAEPGAAPRFVVHEHRARSHHYDLRLEIDGVLVSWAVPKGPSYDPDVKRLAIRTEDHPLAYADFEGVIPEGQYGAGSVILWDHGTWRRAHEDKARPAEGLAEGHLAMRLQGEKLRGDWALIRTGEQGGREQWLFFKMQGPDADPDLDITAQRPESVLTGRTIDELAHSSGPGPDKLFGGLPQDQRANLIRAEQPEWIAPMLASLTDEPFSDPDWLFERKLDGERCLAFRRGEDVRLMSRNRRLINHAYPELVEAIAALEQDNFILDGEIVAFDEGRTSFALLQQRMHLVTEAQARRSPVVVHYCVFDLLHLAGYDTTRLALRHRQALLTVHFRLREPLRPTDHRLADGEAFYEEACEAGWEGLVAKQASSPYESGRSRRWLKLKCVSQQEFVIGGWTDPSGARTGFGSLLLGYYEDGQLRYAGKVGTGFTERQLQEIGARLRELERDQSPFAPGEKSARGDHYVAPQLVAEVGYTEWTEAGSLRHPSFLGLRDDIDPEQVVRELVEAHERPRPQPAALEHEVSVSNPDKLLFPAAGVTKADYVEYYRLVAEVMLPHVRGRPLSLLRFPDGPAGEHFFQKNAPEFFPAWVARERVESEEGGDAIEYAVAENADTLIYLANLVCELHIWTSRRERLLLPDRMVFDLDPPDEGEFAQVVAAARTTRELLEEIGLAAYVMTSGSRGLHVVTPLLPEVPVEEVAEFAQALAGAVASHDPEHLTVEHRKAKRKGRLLIDPWRNSRAQTSVAPYTIRARPRAPVATPLDWGELDDAGLTPQTWTIHNLRERLAQRGDPWAGIDEHGRSLRAVIDRLTR
ncbi:MAG: DNA ligase D [Armatimonadota bacterium]